MPRKKGRTAEKVDKMILSIKNSYVKGFLIAIRYNTRELLFVILLLVIFVKKEWLKKIPFVGKIFSVTEEKK
jgi:hypothetical protein